MTPQDQQLIEGLIERARPLASPPDPEAERLLSSRLAAEPALAAALVRRVAQLEASLADAQQRLSALPAPATGGGSFLGGVAASVFGGATARPAAAPVTAPPQPVPPSPPPAYAPAPSAPAYAPGPAYAPQPAAPAWGGGGGGGFLRGAAQTATGVAGGVLAAEAVEGLAHQLGWSQHHPDGFFGGSIPPAGTAPEEVIVNNYYVEQPPADDTAQADDAGTRNDASDSDVST